MAEAIEYKTSSREAADYFDKIIATTCFQAIPQTDCTALGKFA